MFHNIVNVDHTLAAEHEHFLEDAARRELARGLVSSTQQRHHGDTYRLQFLLLEAWWRRAGLNLVPTCRRRNGQTRFNDHQSGLPSIATVELSS